MLNGGLLQPAWTPTTEFIETTNLAWLMKRVGLNSYDALHAWSVQHRETFWEFASERLGVRFQTPPVKTLDLSSGMESPCWISGATLNIVESCFSAPSDSVAILHQVEGGELQSLSVRKLANMTDLVATNLVRRGLRPGEAVAIFMPMTAEAVAIYLGIIKAGCVVVGIADSFRPKEIATRLRIANTKAVFTQDVMLRGGKSLPLYASLMEADPPPVIVIPARDRMAVTLRSVDCDWHDFLQPGDHFDAVSRQPTDPTNILFSSGTTGDPKAIPWNQTTPVKCAVDAHFHQNVQPGDVVVWPTNIGWMMGPWLIFASLLNRAKMGLYSGAPTGREFGLFVERTRTTMLGVVPSLVKTWRNSNCLTGIDWSSIKLFSSTGECSHADDMHWLMQQAGGKPVIEYCGGTEIGGGYITGTVTRPCVPGTFNTPALGLDFLILDETGQPAEEGELFLVPPSIGLSTTLLNQDHHDVYYANVPRGLDGEILRRHGDQMKQLPGGYWRAQGRADDTMNLGGIKVSSAEIEQVLQRLPEIVEVAAIAVSPDDGPSQLVVYAVCVTSTSHDKEQLLTVMRTAIKEELNPLFKIQDLVLVAALPRTASNKVMRRVLRDRYLSNNP